MAQRTRRAQRHRPAAAPSRWSQLHREGRPGPDRGRDRLRQGALVGVVFLYLASVFGSSAAISATKSSPTPLPQSAFRPVEAPVRPRTTTRPILVLLDPRTAPPVAHPTPSPSPTARPVPSPKPRAPRTRPTPRPASASSSFGSSIRGTATWYCVPGTSKCPHGYTGGLYAAISPDLARWRGDHVRVCYRASCVVVKIVDCDCQAFRSIDLFGDAFRHLAPLSAGRLHGVRISH